MAKIYRQLELGNIEEGDLLKEIDRELFKLQRYMTEYLNKHGDAAEKAAGELTLKIKIKIGSASDELFLVTSGIASKTPSRPAVQTVAISEFDDNNQPGLFVRSNGSDETSPRQGKMFNRKGETLADVDED